MSRARVAVLKVISKQLSVTAAAAEYGYSRQHLHRLIARYQAGGLDAVEPRSRRPAEQPAGDRGQGPRLHRRDPARADRSRAGTPGRSPSPGTWSRPGCTSRRPRRSAGSCTPPGWSPPSPASGPARSYLRFEAAQPNECWQSDFTHWRLADGSDVEIINWLDDHSRYLLACSAWSPVTGEVVVDTFLQASNAHGLPAATLTDNGRVYTARFGGGRNAFEYLLAALGIPQKNGQPFHPQTQGKIERFHQTQKRWLGRAAARRHPRRPAGPARRLPRALQRAPPPPGTAALHPGPGLPRPAQGRALRRPVAATTGCATTTSTKAARSASATPAACTTSASASLTAARKSSPSPTPPASPSSNCGPAKSCPSTTSTPPAATGATNSEARADGPGSLSPKSRLRCLTCRDSRHGGAKGIRTPDPLLAKQVLFQLSYSPRCRDIGRKQSSRARRAASR